MNGKPVFDPSLVHLATATERRAVAERIAIWERLFGIPLPDAKDHPLVRVVIAHTGLTAADIHEEQQRRRHEFVRQQ